METQSPPQDRKECGVSDLLVSILVITMWCGAGFIGILLDNRLLPKGYRRSWTVRFLILFGGPGYLVGALLA